MLKTKIYHVHVYYNLNQFELASSLRDKFQREVSGIQGIGPLRKIPVGPHPTPMFEAWFPDEVLSSVVKWMEVNNNGLSVMFHPLSGNDLADHELHSVWIGEPLPLKLEIFR